MYTVQIREDPILISSWGHETRMMGTGQYHMITVKAIVIPYQTRADAQQQQMLYPGIFEVLDV